MTPELIVAMTGMVAAVGALVNTFRISRKSDEAKTAAIEVAVRAELAAAEAAAAATAIIETKDGIFEIGKKLDGRLQALLDAKDELLAASVAKARAEGQASGEQAERDRQRPTT